MIPRMQILQERLVRGDVLELILVFVFPFLFLFHSSALVGNKCLGCLNYLTPTKVAIGQSMRIPHFHPNWHKFSVKPLWSHAHCNTGFWSRCVFPCFYCWEGKWCSCRTGGIPHTLVELEKTLSLRSTGWLLVYPSEKYEFVNWDDNRNPILMGK